MKIHLYALCWNEADVLKFFFDHYDSWVDRFYVYDDGSTDGSQEILNSHPKVELRNWKRKFPDSYFMSQKSWLNNVWKESRGSADWVVIVDIDEHLIIPGRDMKEFLSFCKDEKITYIPALGFQMISDDFPNPGETLTQTRTIGAPEPHSCKMSVFDPKAIEETNFTGGRHVANFTGRLKLPPNDELFLFHYKYLGLDRAFKKQDSQRNNVGIYDVSMKLFHLSWSREERRKHWDKFQNNAIDLLNPVFNSKKYPYQYRWWRPFTRWVIRGQKFIHRPMYMIGRLKALLGFENVSTQSENFERYIETIYQSTDKKKLYQQIMMGGENGNRNKKLIASNMGEAKSVLINFIHSSEEYIPQDVGKIQKVLAEKNYLNCENVVITNSIGFESNAVKFARENNIKLVSRDNLLEYISTINITDLRLLK